MENKEQYYYPSVEDIHIGWEGEVNWNKGYEETYYPEIVKLKDENGIYLRELEELTCAIDDGYAEARTPFLTKEQIVSEGWLSELILIECNDEDKFVDGFTIYLNGDHWFQLELRYDQQIRIMEKYYRNEVAQIWRMRYDGPCPTINELRTLMRWFNIKK